MGRAFWLSGLPWAAAIEPLLPHLGGVAARGDKQHGRKGLILMLLPTVSGVLRT
jgi:hypothetical protein